MPSTPTLFLGLYVFRFFNSLLTQTAFVPDEIWQSIEVAHNWAFGYGALTWEWLPDVALRSPFHPAIISVLYYASGLFKSYSNTIVFLIPRILHTLLAAVADLYLYKLVLSISSEREAKWTLFHQLCNWFTFYCAPRSLSNCVEWCLTTVALSCFPWSLLSAEKSHPSDRNIWKFISVAVLCVLIRPTAAVIWGPVCLKHLYLIYTKFPIRRARRNSKTSILESPFMSLILKYGIIGCLFGLLSCLLDRFWFGRWTLSQWNFLLFNVFTDGSRAYGVHPWHWYFIQGLPAMLTSQYPFMLLGIFPYLHSWSGWHESVSKVNPKPPKSADAHRFLRRIVIWTVCIYSFQAHKEFRFLFPLLPVLMYFCAKGTTFLGLNNRTVPRNRRLLAVNFRSMVFFLLITQIPMALYFCLVHQRGTLSALSAVSQHIRHLMPKNHSTTLLALMPCHSLPSVGYMHLNVSFEQLGCDPDLSGWSMSNPYNRHTEASDFYEGPTEWLLRRFSSASSKPNYIFIFDHLFTAYPQAKRLLLVDWDYLDCGRFFHAHFPTHPQHGRFVHVLCAGQNEVF